MIDDQETSGRPRLTPEASELIQRAVADIASPRPISWESLVAAVCLLLLIIHSHTAIAGSEPAILRYSMPYHIVHITLCALVVGFGFSALRQRRKNGRIIGGLSFLIGVISVGAWFYVLTRILLRV